MKEEVLMDRTSNAKVVVLRKYKSSSQNRILANSFNDKNQKN